VVALIAAGLFFLWRGSAAQKIALLAGAPILLAFVTVMMPQSTWYRVRAFLVADPNIAEEARESSAMRMYLLRTSVAYTFRRPLFGFGPGQFGTYESMNTQLIGTHGYGHDTHNTYTQVSSECGIPAALLYIAGIVSSFRLLGSAFRQSRARQDCQDIRLAAFCIMLGMVGYCVAIAFLNFAYFFYLPAMAGLAIAFSRAAQREFRTRGVDLAGSRAAGYV
jgi:O-antigen ligase